MAAEFIRKGSVVADIGTDHANLPAYLISQGVCEKAFAADIGKGPLLNARKTVEEYGLEDKITLVLSDGLKCISLDEIDTIVLAGMGGDLINDILSAADIEKLKKIHIIVQPQSHSEKVRSFFCENGFEIEKESFCEEGRHIYVCMSAFYTGRTEYPVNYEYYGEMPKNKCDEAICFMNKQLSALNKKLEAYKKMQKTVEAAEAEQIINSIRAAMGEE